MSKKFAKIAAVATLCACIFGTVCFTACEGTPGTPGTAGKSAYQAWLDAGNTGDEQDFLDSLVGEPGTTPQITISDDGYWEIDGVKTDQKAQGESGQPGKNGNKIYHGEGDPNALNLAAEEGDMYVDTKGWNVYFFEGTEWKDYGSIKGKDGSDPKPTPTGTEIDIQANDEQEINVDLSEGVHIIKADLGTTTLTTGKLQAQIGDVVSQLELSETRSAAAGSDHHIYFGFIVVPAETKTIKILAKNEAVKGSITFEDYVQPTLSIGSTVEIPVNYQNIAEPIAIKLDNSIKNSTTYKLTITCTSDATVMNVYLNSDSTQAMFVSSLTYGEEQNAKFTTLKDSDNTLHLTVPGLTTNLYAATIKLENA